MVPPVPAPPLPVTVRPPLVPVVLRMMPFDELFAPDPDEMLRNVSPAAPMVVFETLSAVPAVVESVLTIEELFCVAVTVPPPVAVKESFAPVVRLRPLVKLMIAVLLLFRKTPVPPFDEIAPPKATVPPAVLPCTSTTRAVLFVMVPL